MAIQLVEASKARIPNAVMSFSVRRRRVAKASGRTTMGPRMSAEYLLMIASTKNAVNPVMFRAVGRRHVRQRKYTAPKMKQVTPKSVVMSDECAAMFGSIV